MSSVRSYIIGPLTLEQWFEESEKAKSRLAEFAQDNRHLDVRTSVLTTDITNYYYIKIDISELSDY